MAHKKLKALVDSGQISELWLNLSRDLIRDQFDSGPYSRGSAYQKSGHVTHLSVEDDTLTAEVWGSSLYTTTVMIDSDGYTGAVDLTSDCTCPYENDCKHGAAALLELLINGISDADDKPASRAGRKSRKRKPLAAANIKTAKTISKTNGNKAKSDSAILAYLKKKPAAELAQYALELMQKLPGEYQDLRERLILESADVNQLMQLVDEEMARLKKRFDGSANYGYTREKYDFSKLDNYLNLLLQAGRVDDVLKLAHEIIQNIYMQNYRIYRGDPVIASFRTCIPTIHRALEQSNCTSLEKLQFWFVPIMRDMYRELVNVDEIFEPKLGKARFWSTAADALRALMQQKLATEDSPYKIGMLERGVDTIIICLNRGNRADEVLDLYRYEAGFTHSNKRLIQHLIATGAFDEARTEILKKIDHIGGLTVLERAECLGKLASLAEKQGDWVSLTAIHSVEFFTQPLASAVYEKMIKSAKKIGKDDEVWAAVQAFIVSKKWPFEKADRRLKTTKAKEQKQQSSWPIPIPNDLWRLMPKTYKYQLDESDLLKLALAGKHLEDLIRHYEELRAKETDHDSWFPILENYLDPVAQALSKKYPQKSVAYYMEAVQLGLREENRKAYQYSANYLAKMYPLFVSMRMQADWHALVQSIRDSYPKKRVLLEILQKMELKLPI